MCNQTKKCTCQSLLQEFFHGLVDLLWSILLHPVTAVSNVPAEEGESARARELTILIAILVPTFPDLFTDNKLTILNTLSSIQRHLNLTKKKTAEHLNHMEITW